MNDLCEVVITAPNSDWLIEFCRRLVGDGLVASMHSFAPIRSIYIWDGEVRDHSESRAALHTRTLLVPKIAERLDIEHPYDVPGIVALPLIAASNAYAEWIRAQTCWHI